MAPPLEKTFRVALFDEFLDAFAKIPRAQQKKVNKFIRLFRENPTSSAINYESISAFADQNLKTVRIDQAYRAIVLRPDQGNVYVLLWVDHHDEAMRWAQNKTVSIHPSTGALQVLSADAARRESAPPSSTGVDAPPLYEQYRDRELLRLGVPAELLGLVRTIHTPQQLDDVQAEFPCEAYEALFFLAAGDSIEEVERELASGAVENVDVGDFGAALERDTSKRRFAVVEDDEALEAMLDAPLEKWRVFLHPSQRRLVYRSWNGPVRVLGGAGTGKTVVAMHRAVYLAFEVFHEDSDRVLFTTFTRNLAADIEANLKKICPPNIQRRIEVTHIDKWTADLLRKSGYDYKIAYWGQSQKLSDAWASALALKPQLDLEDSFYRDEWELVVQPQGCETWDDYKGAGRSGRGRRLSRSQRKAIWPVFAGYRNRLEKLGLREPEDALRDALEMIDAGKAGPSYKSVVVDEAQDMSTNAFALLRKVTGEHPDDMFIVGDGHQRIYRKKVVLSRANIDIVGRGKKLRINYRTTEEIRNFAVGLLEGATYDNLDGEADRRDDYKSLMRGAPPDVRVLDSFDKEVEVIADWIARGELQQTCLVARTKNLRDKYNAAIQKRGFETYEVKRNVAEDITAPGLRVATMHRVKGLEYTRIVIAGVNDDLMPSIVELKRSQDPVFIEEIEQRERALFYVAATRAKKALLVTTHGAPSRWLKGASF